MRVKSRQVIKESEGQEQIMAFFREQLTSSYGLTLVEAVENSRGIRHTTSNRKQYRMLNFNKPVRNIIV